MKLLQRFGDLSKSHLSPKKWAGLLLRIPVLENKSTKQSLPIFFVLDPVTLSIVKLCLTFVGVKLRIAPPIPLTYMLRCGGSTSEV
ncbi:hypothetical protein NIES4073_31160 [Kalymmatonema gypsitolerans NIES-4073]|jgi:hypothetical protein|nr:hypothetical protein NIES4073_31160 [Scytonema sp. NIES-4073]